MFLPELKAKREGFEQPSTPKGLMHHIKENWAPIEEGGGGGGLAPPYPHLGESLLIVSIRVQPTKVRK